MRYMLAMLTILVWLAGLTAGSERAGEGDRRFLESFWGLWKQEWDGETYSLEIRDREEIIGVIASEVLSRSEYDVTAIDRDAGSIVVHGFSRDMTEPEPGPKTEYVSKLVLHDGGTKLLYIYDYANAKVESEWHR